VCKYTYIHTYTHTYMCVHIHTSHVRPLSSMPAWCALTLTFCVANVLLLCCYCIAWRALTLTSAPSLSLSVCLQPCRYMHVPCILLLIRHACILLLIWRRRHLSLTLPVHACRHTHVAARHRARSLSHFLASTRTLPARRARYICVHLGQAFAAQPLYSKP
jgi:hypothetical protein